MSSNLKQPILTIPRIITVTGGKGGTGKTNLAINLAISLAKKQQKILLLDADFGLANVDVMLGLKPKATLADVLSSKAEIQDIIIPGPQDIDIIPAGSGLSDMANLTYQQIRAIIDLISGIDYPPHALIIDTSAGIHAAVMSLAMAADENLVVVCNEPTSIADAYALMKVLTQKHGLKQFKIVTSKVKNERESMELFAKLTKVTDKFLNVSIDLVGSIPFDSRLEKAVKKQQAVVELFPAAESSRAFEQIASKALNWPIRKFRSGNIEFFTDQRNIALANG